MAQKIVRASDGQEIKPASEEKKAAKKVDEAAEAVAEPAEKPAQNVVQAEPAKGNSVTYRILAFVLWALAIACEVLAIMALLDYMYPPFGMSKVLFLIIMIVLDLILAIVAAQLWKKANRIKPMSGKNKVLFYLWSELGVIMACICFLPLIILLLKDKKLDKKSKIIVSIVAIVALLITGVASADFNPITAEEKEEAETQLGETAVYWTTFGHKYHLKLAEEAEDGDPGCPYIRNSATVYTGTVTEAIESGRTAICSYCASHYAEELDLDVNALHVEEAVGEVVDQVTEPAA